MVDAFSSNVVYLVKFNVDGAVSTMTDKLGTPISGYGNSAVVTEGDALTGHYLSLDGTGDYLTTAGTAGILLGSGNFTIDFGIKTAASSTKCLLDFWDGASAGWQLLMNSSGQLVFGNPGSVLVSNGSINDGNRHHVQISRYSNTLYMHIDGARQTNTATVSTNFNTISPLLSIGAQVTSRNAGWDFPGKFDFIRITVGVARGNGASSITPPTLADLGLTIASIASDTMRLGAYATSTFEYKVQCADYARFSTSAVPIALGQIMDGLGLASSIGAWRDRMGLVSETIGLAGVMSARGVFLGTAREWIGLSSEIKATATLSVSVKDGFLLFEARLLGGKIDDALSVWVANLATAAHSRYAQYGFNSFARFGGKHYGCKSDGIYELNGDLDGTGPIKWTATLPETDLGMDEIKRLPYVYIGAKASGNLVLKVIKGPGQVYHFDVVMSGREDRAGRARLAKGLEGRYWRLEIASDTEHVELDSIEFHPVKVFRRV